MDWQELTGETLQGVSWAKADLAGRVFHECEFVGCDLTDANLSRARFFECRVVDSNLSNTRLVGAALRGVEVVRSKVVGVDFGSCDQLLFELGFEDADLRFCTFEGLSWRRARLVSSRVLDCEFAGCELEQASFRGSELTGSTFVRCRLKDADFRGATGYAIDPRDNDLKNARFSTPEVLALLAPFGLRVDE